MMMDVATGTSVSQKRKTKETVTHLKESTWKSSNLAFGKNTL